MKMLLLIINHHAPCWSICSDFNVIAILLGLQTGYTKYCCFLCYWDSHARDKHYTVRVWSERDSFERGQRVVARSPLVGLKNIKLTYLPLHIKLRIVKNVVKAIAQNGNAFAYLKWNIPKLSEMKIKKRVFIGPHICELMQDSKFDECLSSEEKKTWFRVKNVIRNLFQFFDNISETVIHTAKVKRYLQTAVKTHRHDPRWGRKNFFRPLKRCLNNFLLKIRIANIYLTRPNSKKLKPDSYSALKRTSEMIYRIQRGHRSFWLISVSQCVSLGRENSDCIVRKSLLNALCGAWQDCLKMEVNGVIIALQ